MPEKSNASRCVPSSFKIEAAQVVAARRRAGGAWKPAVVPHEIKSRAALALCMVLQPWDARAREQRCWREERLQTQRLICSARSRSLPSVRLGVFFVQICSYLTGFRTHINAS